MNGRWLPLWAAAAAALALRLAALGDRPLSHDEAVNAAFQRQKRSGWRVALAAPAHRNACAPSPGTRKARTPDRTRRAPRAVASKRAADVGRRRQALQAA